MARYLLRALKTYLVVSLIMVMNVALAIGVLWLALTPRQGEQDIAWRPGYKSWEEIPGLKEAKGDRAAIGENVARLNILCQKGLHANLRAVLKYCGKPDAYHGEIHADLNLLYFLNPARAKGRTADVSLKNGFVVGIASMESTGDNLQGYRKWEIPDGDIPTYR